MRNKLPHWASIFSLEFIAEGRNIFSRLSLIIHFKEFFSICRKGINMMLFV